jgi:ectoine hydroxylase-related dioxygenase (phytanoyl-CoA dioxygenase family)
VVRCSFVLCCAAVAADGGAKTTPATFSESALRSALDKHSVSLAVPAGSLVILHGSLVHLSHDNRSARSRHAYTLHATEALNTEYPKSNW